MTTEKPEEGAGANPPEGEPSEQYKGLQRQLESARQRERRLMQDALERSRNEAQVALLTKTVHDLTTKLADSEEDVGEVREALEKGSQALQTQAAFQQQIAEALPDGVDWDEDERLGDAREAWNSGDHAKALRETEKVVGKPSAEDLQQQIKEGVAKVMGEMGMMVDTGDASAPAEAPFSAERAQEVGEAATSDPRAGIDAAEQLLDAFFKSTPRK